MTRAGSLQREDTTRKWLSASQEGALARHWTCHQLDLGLPASRLWEIMSVVEATSKTQALLSWPQMAGPLGTELRELRVAGFQSGHYRLAQNQSRNEHTVCKGDGHSPGLVREFRNRNTHAFSLAHGLSQLHLDPGEPICHLPTSSTSWLVFCAGVSPGHRDALRLRPCR